MRFSLYLLLAAVLGGCTNVYKPVSTWEASVLAQSRRDVFPKDVVGDTSAYGTVLVAWPGVLVDAQIHGGEQPYVDLLVEHRYFDWLEDRSVQRAIYFLSPRGEGIFRATWPLKKEWDLDAMRRLIRPGDMMIVYGRPVSLQEGVINLGQAEYVREIPHPWFADDVLDYGRPGEPSRSLRTPF